MKKKKSSELLAPLGLVEMGHIGEVAMRIVAANLQAVIGIEVDILQPLDVPPEAFLEHRQQHDAGLIVKHISRLSFPHHSRILALTTVDLCSPILTYLYGEAEMGGRVALASSFRLRCNEDGSKAPLHRYYERLSKVSLHEVAHMLSLYHCEQPKCLMRFSARMHHLDQLEIAFCQRCEFMLRERLRQKHL